MRILAFLATLSYISAYVRPNTETSALGAPIGDSTNTLTVGPRGPLLLQDVVFMEKMASFDRERIPARVVHPKGIGAHGYFKVTDDITRYCRAKVFSKIGKTTPVFARLSYALSGEDSADTIRELRGLSAKFYTEEGNWDLVLLNSPVFFIRDAIAFPDLIHSVLRHPVTNTRDPNTFWDFMSLKPETTHQITREFSDLGIPESYRHADFYSGNAFKLVNAQGEAIYCKFLLKTNQGVRNMTVERARLLTMEEPEHSTRDLFNAIKNGAYPSWTMYIQVMTFQQAETWYFNPFDATKIWPEKEFPLIRVGQLVLNRNPSNHFAETEQVAFSPGNLVRGIEPSPDKLLQGRLFSYPDTQAYRLGANFRQIPVNRPLCPVRNYERDGPQTVTDNQDGAPNYHPNSFGGPVGDPSYERSCFVASGVTCRYNSSNEDNFSQAGIFYREVLNEQEKTRLIRNLVTDLSPVLASIQKRAVKNFYQADTDYGRRVQEGLRRAEGQIL